MSEPERNIITFPDRDQSVAAALTVIGLSFERDGATLLDNMHLRLPATGITVIMGPNGAGKSLLLRLVMGLLTPTSGSIQLAGPLSGRLALVFQRPVLLRRTVAGNLDHALRIQGIARRERPSRRQELLRMAGLEALAERPARRLSGGEQQRLAMVRALAAEPGLLLLDEPTASLDPQSTAVIEELIRRAAEEIKIFLVTHDRDQARRLASDVVFLHEGRLVEHQTAARFFASPVAAEARHYLEGGLLI